MEQPKIFRYDTVDSTNTVCKSLAAQGAPSGTAVIARRQTAGRGRMGRSFESPEGLGLYLSVLWRPEGTPEDLLPLTPMAAVSAAMAIQRVTGAPVRIKWPNDLECWGGATFDACMRFLGEDPWERLRTIRKHVKNTKLQMLFRGQNILGYKHYADDVVDAFCAKSIENGIDIIRIFDALNDVRNLEQAIKSTKKYGGQVEATLSYTMSPIHNEAYFVKLAKEL